MVLTQTCPNNVDLTFPWHFHSVHKTLNQQIHYLELVQLVLSYHVWLLSDYRLLKAGFWCFSLGILLSQACPDNWLSFLKKGIYMYISIVRLLSISLYMLCVCLSVHAVWALSNKADSLVTVLDIVLKCDVMVLLYYGESCDRKWHHNLSHWYSSASKLGPESVMVVYSGGDYLLRPETLESIFYLWRLTKNPMYREWRWDVVQVWVQPETFLQFHHL